MIEIYHNGIRKAILTADADGVKEPWVDIRLNGESTFEFLLPLTSRKWPKIIPECRIVADGREYVILRPDAVDAERTQDGKKWGKVTAAESWILLDKDFVSVSNDPDKPTPADMEVRIISGGAAAGGYPQGSAGSALTYILQDSGWTLDTCDVEGVHDIETEKLSRLENIKKVQEIWGGYLVWDSIYRTVSLRSEATWQNYNGFQIRYAKNLKHITRTDNYDIVTRLYPFGKDDLDISSVNDGKKYIDNFSYTANIYEGKYVNQGMTKAQELKERAIAELAKICRPRYTYRVGLVDLRELPEYSHETFTVGDMADVIDPEIGTGRVRILRHKYNLFQRYLCELEIGDPEERLEEQLQASFQTTRYVNTSLGTIVVKNTGTNVGQVPVIGPDGKLDPSVVPTQAIPVASPTVLGGIKVGTTLTIDGNGTLDYEHPSTHPATMIEEDEEHRFVTDDEKSNWNDKVSLESPAFTGTPTAPTAAAGTNTTQIATTAFVQNAISFAGGGDMLKSQYDTDGDGKVNAADSADSVPWSGVSNRPTIPTALSELTDDSLHRTVTDTEKSTWNGKQNALGFTPENVANKGAANGYAGLDVSGKVPAAQLPSFVDDVLEYANLSSFPITGESGIIYVALDTNKTYRWSGSGYVEISQSLALGETSSTAYPGDKGKIAYDHSQSAHAPADAISKTNTDAYTPTANYHPATKKYVDDSVSQAGGGNMIKAVYDTNDDGSVNEADAINGVASAGNSKYYGTDSSGNAGFFDLPSGILSGSSLPSPGVAYRGKTFVLLGGSGVADVPYICLKKADDTYEWRKLPIRITYNMG